MTYAERTKVSISRTIEEIQFVIAKYGCDQFLHAAMHDRLIVGFSKEGRQVRFQVPQDPGDKQVSMQRGRALLLVLKAKLEAVESGVAIFEDEFLANIVMPDGRLVSQHVKPKLELAYSRGECPPLLPNYSETSDEQ